MSVVGNESRTMRKLVPTIRTENLVSLLPPQTPHSQPDPITMFQEGDGDGRLGIKKGKQVVKLTVLLGTSFVVVRDFLPTSVSVTSVFLC